MKIKVRFAPSPTGYIHLGNARMAVLNHFLAKKIGGDYILRIDDTDTKRVKQEYIDAVTRDLSWLGIDYVEVFKQSERIKVYSEFLERLKKSKRVYACYESQEELEYKKKLQLAKGKPPIYDRSMLSLTDEQKAIYEKEGRKPYYRLLIVHEDIQWVDMVKGSLSFKGEHISDPVVVREDGTFLYILTSVIDDIEKEITHIIRGEDHIVNTAVQIQIFKYLNATIPLFAHLPLITNNEGIGFSKREGSLSLYKLKEQGILPLALHNYLFSLGLSANNNIYKSVSDIVKDFNLSDYNSASAQYNEQRLNQINMYLLLATDFLIIKNMVNELLELSIEEKFWNVVKNNLHKFTDLKSWYNIIYNEVNYIDIKDINKETIAIILKYIPDVFDESVWNIWLLNIKNNSNLQNTEIYKTLRYILTGLLKGPEFKELILAIGREKIQARLKKALQ